MTTSYVDRRLFDIAGEKIGTITDVIHRPDDLTAEWLTVRMGWFRREHLVPVSHVETVAGRLVTRLDRRTIASSPGVHDHYRPTSAQQMSLLEHYGLASEEPVSPADEQMPSLVEPLSSFAEPLLFEPIRADAAASVGSSAGHAMAGFIVVLDEAVGATLLQTLDEAATHRPRQVHLVVPVSPVSADIESFTRRESDGEVSNAGATLAQWQLAAAIRQLAEHGFSADGLVADEDPVAEVVQLVRADPTVDGVIVSTRSDTISRWLGRDLPARIKRACPVPIVAVIVDDDPLAA